MGVADTHNPAAETTSGMTPNELAKVLRVSPDRIRAWIKTGELGAVNVADHQCGRPRFIILPHHLTAFEKRRSGAPPPKPPRRQRRTEQVDYFPD
jgi:excisionase family DNA binding protein